jgi:xanthine dehydrogenase accessory factor
VPFAELEQIAAVWKEAWGRGESGVLATVVRIHGSTYRRAGAKLLLTSGGRRSGAVSGGCLEADLVKKAWWLTEGGTMALRRYDTSADGEIAQEFGLGCNGVIHILLERLREHSLSPLDAVGPIKETRRAAALGTLISTTAAGPLRIGQRWLRLPGGNIETDLPDSPIRSFLSDESSLAIEHATSHVVTWRNESQAADFFIEPLFPALRLLVMGAGDDAIPVTRFAKFMGYEVVVLDGRSHMARADRFPQADRVVVNSSVDPLAGIPVDQWTAAVLMSHSYEQDRNALRRLAAEPLQYLGILGPRKRTEQMLGDIGVSEETLPDNLHSPVGLDIGADGPEQIALAVIAEIQAVLNQRVGGRLRVKAGPLHPRTGVSANDPDFLANTAGCALNAS